MQTKINTPNIKQNTRGETDQDLIDRLSHSLGISAVKAARIISYSARRYERQDHGTKGSVYDRSDNRYDKRYKIQTKDRILRADSKEQKLALFADMFLEQHGYDTHAQPLGDQFDEETMLDAKLNELDWDDWDEAHLQLATEDVEAEELARYNALPLMVESNDSDASYYERQRKYLAKKQIRARSGIIDDNPHDDPIDYGESLR